MLTITFDNSNQALRVEAESEIDIAIEILRKFQDDMRRALRLRELFTTHPTIDNFEMPNTQAGVLILVEEFCKRREISESKFGRLYMNNPSYVRDLRRQQKYRPHEKTMTRLAPVLAEEFFSREGTEDGQ